MPFVCLFVCKITQKEMDGFHLNLDSAYGDHLDFSIDPVPGNRIREVFKFQKQVNI